MNISVKIANITFANPVTVASGTFGHAERYFNLEEVKRLGAIVPKTVTFNAQVGNQPVRIFETPSGMINAIGIENPGIDGFIEKKLPSFSTIGVPLIISILGHTEDQFIGIVEKLNQLHGKSPIAAIELNLSCPNLKHKVLVAQDPQATEHLLKKIKSISKFPVIAKLSPNVTDISEIALAAEAGGADAVSLVNTFTAMAIDVKTRKSRIGNFTGGLSGPAIRPIAVFMVHKVASNVKIPVIGMGGIMTAQDALEFIIAGATMVAVGTSNFVNPRAPIDVLEGIEAYMAEHKINDIKELIGSLKKMSREQLIVALDVDNFEDARKLIDTLEDSVEVFKIGSQMFTAYGPFITRYVQSKGKKVFLDLKFHDIPNTVASAVKSAVGLSVAPNADKGFAPLFMLTIHTSGGFEMMKAAADAAKSQAEALGVTRPLIVGVTVLTSTAADANTKNLVLERARLALQAGLDGVVASVEETAALRAALGKDFLIVTPGIRPADASLDDQKRVATPKVAIEQGSSFLVVGRPIVQAAFPHQAALAILKDIGA